MFDLQIFIVRHGETEWNLQDKMQGHENSPLTENGIAQAISLRKKLPLEKISAIYSSDLGRCKETAKVIAANTGIKIISTK